MKLWDDSGALSKAGIRLQARAQKAIAPLFRGLSARECLDAEVLLLHQLLWLSTNARLRKMGTSRTSKRRRK